VTARRRPCRIYPTTRVSPRHAEGTHTAGSRSPQTAVQLPAGARLRAALCGKRPAPALAGEDLIARLHAEGRRAVDRRVVVTLLKTVVLLDVVEVVLADDDGVLHLGGLDHAGDQLTPDVDRARPRALLVNIRSLDGGPRRLDAQADRLVVTRLALRRLLPQHTLLPNEDAVLLLISPLVLLDLRGDSDGRHRKKWHATAKTKPKIDHRFFY